MVGTPSILFAPAALKYRIWGVEFDQCEQTRQALSLSHRKWGHNAYAILYAASLEVAMQVRTR
jgi:hypothetical protein